MGNSSCSGARDTLNVKKQASAAYYSQVKKTAGEKMHTAKTKAKDKYTVAKLMAKGYKMNNFQDNGETKCITDFENQLPICKVALDDFEKRIKDFQNKEENKGVQKVTIA